MAVQSRASLLLLGGGGGGGGSGGNFKSLRLIQVQQDKLSVSRRAAGKCVLVIVKLGMRQNPNKVTHVLTAKLCSNTLQHQM